MKKVAKVILHKHGKVLLQLRDNKPSIPFPNQWSLFGGLIEKDETPEDCVRREIKEELEATLKDVLLITNQIRKEGDKEVEDNIFSAEIVEEISELRLHEGSGMQLFLIKELNELKVVPHYKPFIINFLHDSN